MLASWRVNTETSLRRIPRCEGRDEAAWPRPFARTQMGMSPMASMRAMAEAFDSATSSRSTVFPGPSLAL